MARLRRRGHAVRDAISDAQELELVIGPFGTSAFESDAARRTVYFAHKEFLMAGYSNTWAWIQYEAGGFLPSEGNHVLTAQKRLGVQCHA